VITDADLKSTARFTFVANFMLEETDRIPSQDCIHTLIQRDCDERIHYLASSGVVYDQSHLDLAWNARAFLVFHALIEIDVKPDPAFLAKAVEEENTTWECVAAIIRSGVRFTNDAIKEAIDADMSDILIQEGTLTLEQVGIVFMNAFHDLFYEAEESSFPCSVAIANQSRTKTTIAIGRCSAFSPSSKGRMRQSP